jgi:hypothetical protein
VIGDDGSTVTTMAGKEIGKDIPLDKLDDYIGETVTLDGNVTGELIKVHHRPGQTSLNIAGTLYPINHNSVVILH